MNTTLLLVGCGKMGGAMLDGWLAHGLDPDRVWIVEPNAETAADLASRLGVHTLKPDVVLFAVKPQVMDQAMPPYARLAGPDTVFLSIAAGRTLASFGAALGAEIDVALYLASRHFGLRSFAALFGGIIGFGAVNAAIGPYVAGLLHDISGSYDPLLIVTSVMLVLGALAIATIGRPPELLHGAGH